jgi:hypothetical protein
MPFPVPSSQRFGSGNNAPLKKSQINIGYCLKTVDGSELFSLYTKVRLPHFILSTILGCASNTISLRRRACSLFWPGSAAKQHSMTVSMTGSSINKAKSYII